MPNAPDGNLLEQIQQEIASRNLGWEADHTHITVLPPEEQAKFVGFDVSNDMLISMGQLCTASESYYRNHVGALLLDPVVDWSDRNGASYVKNVKNQGACLSCVAFAVIGAIEANQRIASNNPDLDLNYSESHLFSCGCNQCCQTGWQISEALEFSKTRGIVPEADAPYRPINIMCPGSSSPPFKIQDWSRIFTTDGIKQALASGPVVGAMQVYRDFYYYQSGVYHFTGNNPGNDFVGNHAILVIGYDDNQGCWICKNSWGPNWGSNARVPGHFNIAYSDPTIRGTLPTGEPFAFETYSVTVAPSANGDPGYLPELQQTLQTAQGNPALRAYLQYSICRQGAAPPYQPVLDNIAGSVWAVLQQLPPTYYSWFCENL